MPAYGAPQRIVRSARGLTIALFFLAPSLVLARLLVTALAPTVMEVGPGNAYMSRDGPFALIALLIWIPTTTIGLIWAYRVAANANALSGGKGPSPGWAIGNWFIPLANVVLSVLVVLKVWRNSRAGSQGLVVGWGAVWALYLVFTFALFVASFVWGFAEGFKLASGESTTLTTPAWIVGMQWVNIGLYTLAAALFLPMAWMLVARQDRALRPQSGATQQGTWNPS